MNSFPPIEELLAHRDNMLLLEAVTEFSDTEVSCLARPDSTAWYALGPDETMPAWVGIELMAQSIAVHVALLSLRVGGGPKPGVLLGTRNYQANQAFFPADEPLIVRATESCRTGNGVASYDCIICSAAGEQMATAALTVYEPADFELFILGTEA